MQDYFPHALEVSIPRYSKRRQPLSTLPLFTSPSTHSVNPRDRAGTACSVAWLKFYSSFGVLHLQDMSPACLPAQGWAVPHPPWAQPGCAIDAVPLAFSTMESSSPLNCLLQGRVQIPCFGALAAQYFGQRLTSAPGFKKQLREEVLKSGNLPSSHSPGNSQRNLCLFHKLAS